MNTQEKIVATVKQIEQERPEITWVLVLCIAAGVLGVTFPQVEIAVKQDSSIQWGAK